ncbi:MAG: transcription antitermination factor NusB, partial [Pseudomonadota bacterium]
MKPSTADPVRKQACLALDRVLREGRSLDVALPSDGLTGQARSRCRALVFASCRWFPRIDAVLKLLITKPLRRRDQRVSTVLTLALTELIYFESPAHAVVDNAVQLTRSLGHRALSGLVNAVLRRFLRERDALLDQVDRDPATAAALPAWLYDTVAGDWRESAVKIASASNERAPMTLRVGPQQSRDAYRSRLQAAGIDAACGPGLSDLILAQPVAVTELPGFASGDCSVQDSAAQFAAALLAPQAGERVLDACAAPGGKTGHLLEQGCQAHDLTALDASADRLQRVR